MATKYYALIDSNCTLWGIGYSKTEAREDGYEGIDYYRKDAGGKVSKRDTRTVLISEATFELARISPVSEPLVAHGDVYMLSAESELLTTQESLAAFLTKVDSNQDTLQDFQSLGMGSKLNALYYLLRKR